MNDTPNPSIGDVIEIVTRSYPERETTKAKIVDKFELMEGVPSFTSYTCRINRRHTKVSWNPLIQAFFIPDYTD